jgi:hypothetical protein
MKVAFRSFGYDSLALGPHYFLVFSNLLCVQAGEPRKIQFTRGHFVGLLSVSTAWSSNNSPGKA